MRGRFICGLSCACTLGPSERAQPSRIVNNFFIHLFCCKECKCQSDSGKKMPAKAGILISFRSRASEGLITWQQKRQPSWQEPFQPWQPCQQQLFQPWQPWQQQPCQPWRPWQQQLFQPCRQPWQQPEQRPWLREQRQQPEQQRERPWLREQRQQQERQQELERKRQQRKDQQPKRRGVCSCSMSLR